jgi:hypothetical protein
MVHASQPFAVTHPVAASLDAVLSYWQDLRRGEASIPFWDDLRLADAKATGAEVFLVDVFATPERFRFAEIDMALDAGARDAVLGRFIDEVALPHGFEMLRAQCAATVEGARATVYSHEPAEAGERGYERLLLPLWGEGQVHMLLGALARL